MMVPNDAVNEIDHTTVTSQTMSSDNQRRRSSASDRTDKERDGYFQAHKCTLNYIPNKYAIRCGRVQRFILYLTAVNLNDVRARSMFKSYASLCSERYRQFTQHPITIHPFSRLRYMVEIIVALSIALHNAILPFWITEFNPNLDKILHDVLCILQMIYICINIPANALTGYIDGKNDQNIVLEKCKILKNYFCTWMIIDLVAFSCMACELDTEPNPVYQLVHLLSVFQLLVLYRYTQNIYQALQMGVPSQTAMEFVLFLGSYLAWNITFQFAIEYYNEGGPSKPTNPRNCSWLTIENLWHKPGRIRLITSLHRAVAMLRSNSNLNHLAHDGCFEKFYIVTWLIAHGLIVHCSLKYMLALFGSQSAKMKYYVMSRQLKTYMDQRRFPPRLQNKILKFYSIRFQSHFFVESTMLECVSGQLREDIVLRTSRHLLRRIPFLKQLPRSVLIQISLKFELAIFIEGDIIYKANTPGDCMYFIHKGTITIYTVSGCEIYHCEDGDYFGEVALATHHRNRWVTVVAVTNCELFCLTRENFEMIKSYPTAYDEIKKAALRRLQLYKVTDEQYKAELRNLQMKK